MTRAPYTRTLHSVNLIDAQGETVWHSVPAGARDGLRPRQHVATVVGDDRLRAMLDDAAAHDAAGRWSTGDGIRRRVETMRAAFPPRYRATCTCNGLRSPWSTNRADADADLAGHVCSDRVADVIAAGGALVEVTREVELSPCDQVIAAACDDARDAGTYRDGDDVMLGQAMTRFLNMTPDAGRPSDAARSVCREYASNPQGMRDRVAATMGRQVTSW